MTELMEDWRVASRVLDHIDHGTTDLSDTVWREPVQNYTAPDRLAAELAIMRATPTPFCPSLAIPDPGSYLARAAAGTPILAVRGADGVARAFRNACRHRGAEVACGAGKAATFACPYHAWTYDLTGALRGVPHENGFPGLDKGAHGLVPVACVEAGGVLYVTQDPSPGVEAVPPAGPTGIDPRFVLIGTSDQIIEANWKIVMEGFLEGYHIKATHKETFYPRQYDNLNVVEYWGANSRVTFPYKAIERQRDTPPMQRRAGGALTFLYHLFPNVVVPTFPGRSSLVVNEPNGAGRTRQITWTFADPAALKDERAPVSKGLSFVDAGVREDRAVNESIQRGLASGANTAFTYGLFEGAITHMHRNLHARLAAMGAAAG